MRALALDTSTRATSVAVWDGAAAAAPRERREDPPAGERPGHASRLLALADELLREAGWTWESLERIVVGQGPGTFTGLRIGIASARALAHALGVALTAVPTLESLALNAVGQPVPAVLAVLDARRGETFTAAWELGRDGLGRRLAPAAVTPPAALPELVAGLPSGCLATGEGALAFREVLARASAVVPANQSEVHRVSAASHLRLAHGRPGRRPEEVLPEYLRLPDAELARRAAAPPAPDVA